MNSIAIVRIKNTKHLAIKEASKLILTANNLIVSYKPTGQPFLKNYPNLSCSISHSGIYESAAIADYCIGIDIEKVKKRNEALGFYIASENELAFIDHIPIDARLTCLWTLKESVMKSKGYGLSISPKHLSLLACKNNIWSIQMNEPSTHSLWNVYNYLHSGYYLSIAIPNYIDETPNISWNI